MITTQKALTEALGAGTTRITVELRRGKELQAADIPAGTTITVEGYGRLQVSGAGIVYAYGKTWVSAAGDLTVYAYDTAKIDAWGRAIVHATSDTCVSAQDQASVNATDNARVSAFENATVTARDAVSVEADGAGVTVHAYDRAQVDVAYGSRINAYDRSTVHARNGRVHAHGTAVVHAGYNAKVTAGKNVSVYQHHRNADITGGNIIAVPSDADRTETATWLDHYGVPVTNGRATLYKAVGKDLYAGYDHGRPTRYTVGATVTAEDWRPDNECGGGLHVSPAPHHAASYRTGSRVVRYMRVTADVEYLQPIENGSGEPKCKARTVVVEAEVDEFGRDLPARPED